ncbi:hypothetical protein M951_chr352 (nucleomorph) [Lotharella oceanica]|uniref:Uncharacterized protein n=1 Tax=Lotharella oceanica TaxID=641309 RepID=A0A060DGL1_9EUKA|nr:hypothetical protein M951_chr352 [Lotharella oceanica]
MHFHLINTQMMYTPITISLYLLLCLKKKIKNNYYHELKKHILYNYIYFYFINEIPTKKFIVHITDIIIYRKNILMIKYMNYLSLIQNFILYRNTNTQYTIFKFIKLFRKFNSYTLISFINVQFKIIKQFLLYTVSIQSLFIITIPSLLFTQNWMKIAPHQYKISQSSIQLYCWNKIYKDHWYYFIIFYLKLFKFYLYCTEIIVHFLYFIILIFNKNFIHKKTDINLIMLKLYKNRILLEKNREQYHRVYFNIFIFTSTYYKSFIFFIVLFEFYIFITSKKKNTFFKIIKKPSIIKSCYFYKFIWKILLNKKKNIYQKIVENKNMNIFSYKKKKLSNFFKKVSTSLNFLKCSVFCLNTKTDIQCHSTYTKYYSINSMITISINLIKS